MHPSLPKLLCGLLLLACGQVAEPSADVSGAAGPPAAVDAAELARLGEGFVVWESNRTGDWRIWLRRLDGSGPRQLSPDEAGMQHCCPLVAPDGRRVAYVSRATGRDEYPEREAAGPLRLIDLGSGGERTLAPEARSYGWGNRAAVWRSDLELIYVGGDGRTHLLDLESSRSRPLTSEPRAELAWLVDPTLRFATGSEPSFAPYDGERRRVLERRSLGGCEAYFSHDGRWGYWIAGAGGPVHRIDLASREISTLLRKNDPRLAGGQGYLYFPMSSRDGRLFAFGASADEHDHFRSNYDIYVARSDPRTLELLGEPVRLTTHPASDRYPDAFLTPLELGRHDGEAPLTVRFDAGTPGELEWDWGDGSPRERGAAAAGHTFRDPGAYEVRAAEEGRVLRGRVVVASPRPPRAIAAELEAGGRRIVVRFDEEVAFDDLEVALASGIEIAGWRPGDDGRSLLVDLGGELAAADRLRLAGIADRAQAPNRMPPAELDVAAPAWPSDRRGLAFLWQTGDRPNLVWDPELGGEVSYPLTPRGRARLDRHWVMVLGGGAFTAPPEAAERLLAAALASNELGLEAVLATADLAQSGPARILTFSSNHRRRNLTLGQEGRWLVLRLRTGPTGPNADKPQVRLFELVAGEPVHLALTYSPGVLRVYRDGEEVRVVDDIRGGLNRWERRELLFGDEANGGADWAGTLEGIALYDRVLTAGEVRENYLRYLKTRRERPAVPRLVVRARLRARSAIPTLAEITPYRQALAVYEWRVEEVLAGAGAPPAVRVAHWAILDGETQPIASAREGAEARLVLEPFADNPQLESHYLSDTLEESYDLPLFHDAG